MNRLGAIALAALLLSAAACGDDDEEPAASGAPATSSSAPETAETIDITAIDYAFEGVPESIEPGTKLTLANSSTTEVHELVALPIPADETRPAAEIVADGAALGRLFGGGPPAAVIVAAPGSSMPGAVEGDGTLTEPGRYLLLCAIPTGADPEEYMAAAAESTGGPVEVPGGPPHFAQGMVTEVTVGS